MISGFEKLNGLPREEVINELLKCCGSRKWAELMADARPLNEMDPVLRTSDRIWWGLDAADWLEAFDHHPKIGERRAAQAVSREAQQWSEEEQAGTRASAQETMMELEAANREYERRFGFIFIVCASGRTTEEMLATLKERMKNDTDKELRVAAEEQRRITHLRLQKLLDE